MQQKWTRRCCTKATISLSRARHKGAVKGADSSIRERRDRGGLWWDREGWGRGAYRQSQLAGVKQLTTLRPHHCLQAHRVLRRSTAIHRDDHHMKVQLVHTIDIFKVKTKGTPLWGAHRLKVLKHYRLRL